MKRKLLAFILLYLVTIAHNSFGQSGSALIKGRITDTSGKALELVNISLKNYPLGTTSVDNGEYHFTIPAKKEFTIVVSSVGYVPQEKKVNANINQTIILNFTLEVSEHEIGVVNVARSKRDNGTMVTIDPSIIESIPSGAAGGVEALIKTLPGVSSNNELSSQYSVRGGNFDENLVYVNGIEVYRPFLVRSGQQEGLSFINSDMVSSIEFSAGGFEAKYGDKMASVLDIKYRKPTEFKGSASISLLGASMHVEDISKNKKLTHISGARYKTNQYLLSSLDEKGEYNPNFLDFQTYISYQVSEKFDISFLGNIAKNTYQFIPETRKTTFGTWNEAYNTTVYFEGQEVDNFATYMGALSADFHPNNNLNLKLIASSYYANEEETYDIYGEYFLNELEKDQASEDFGDSTLNVGTGVFLNHARNKLDARVYSLSHQGAYDSKNHLLKWGFKFQHEEIKDKINEWVYRDSTGYSIPYSDTEVLLYSTTNAKNKLNSNRITAYFQDTYSIPINQGELFLNAGIRAHYWDFNDELVVSPRFILNYYPDWKNNIAFKMSLGMYNQPAFYKELKDRSGNINYNSKAQKSYQVVAGMDYVFTAWDRPFRFSTEAFYKHQPHLVPYQIDNVRIDYLSDQEAEGYSTGIDMKVNGEFVSGLQSWVSLSLLKTYEKIVGDNHGWIPRPTDQWMNFSIYFQDYFPGNPTLKMHLSAFYGARLPAGPPNSERWQDTFRMPPYRRVDMAFSKVLISPDTEIKRAILKPIKDMSLSFEVFNLLNINNTVSYFWVSSMDGNMYAVPNYLTGRRISLKFSVKF